MLLLKSAPDHDNPVVDGTVDQDRLQRGVGAADPEEFALIGQGDGLQFGRGMLLEPEGRPVSDTIGRGEGIEPGNVLVGEGRNLAEIILPMLLPQFDRSDHLGIVRLLALHVHGDEVKLVLVSRPLAPQRGGKEQSGEQETGTHRAKIRGKGPLWQVLPEDLLPPGAPGIPERSFFRCAPAQHSLE